MRPYYIPLIVAFLGLAVACGAEIVLMVQYPDLSDVRRFVMGWPYIVGGLSVGSIGIWLWRELRETWSRRNPHNED